MPNAKKRPAKFFLITKFHVLFFLLFIISRIPFINERNVFFDSKEYLQLFAYPQLSDALTHGHFPYHEGYILLFWPVYQIANSLSLNSAYWVIVAQIMLSFITVYCFYKTISFLSNNKVGLISAVIISLTPLFWITNITIMMETAYLLFFFCSLFLLTRYMVTNKSVYMHLSILTFTFSFITYSGALLWLPLFLSIVLIKKREHFIKIFILSFFTISLFLVGRVFIISEVLGSSPFLTFHQLYTSNITDAGHFQNNFKGFLILLRNFIPPIRSHTSLIVILGLASLVWAFRTNKKTFFIGFLWIAPMLYMNQWWDSLLMGRYSMIAGFGFAYLAGYLLSKHTSYLPAVLLYLFFVSVPALHLLKTDIPYIKEAEYAMTLPKDGLLIESHYAHPVMEKCCRIKIVPVNTPGIGNGVIKKEIEKHLKNKKPVFISSSALSDPYGLYMGPYLHPLSLSYRNKPELKSLLQNYTLRIHKIINKKDNLIVYKISSTESGMYPHVPNLRHHYRRMDYYDPIWRFTRFLEEEIYLKIKPALEKR